MVATRERGSIVFPLPNIDSLRSLTFAHFLQKIPFAPLKPAEHNIRDYLRPSDKSLESTHSQGMLTFESLAAIH